jgi:transcriptional/translational regulatory protein YebC/TACO1
MEVRDGLENEGFTIRSSEIEMIPKTLQKVNGQDAQNALKLLEALDDHDDINHVYSNFDFDENFINQD